MGKRDRRLRTPAEFQRVRELAPRGSAHRLLVVYSAPNEFSYARLGITVSGRVGNAVVRNRVRRRIREAVRLGETALPNGQDVVVVARPSSARASWRELCQAIEQALARVPR